ncbi:hypothetical protein D3C76_1574660 [compost metagenome]
MPDDRIVLQRRELARTVVNQEDLHQQRRAGKQGDIGANNPHQYRRFQRQNNGEKKRQNESHHDGRHGQRQAGM